VALIYLDESIAEVLAFLLVAFGHDAITTRGAGRKGTKDYDQHLFAARASRVLVTYDGGHFGLLHGAWRAWSVAWDTPAATARHAGILVVQQDRANLTTEAMARLVHDFVGSVGALDNRLFDWTRRYGWRELP
jgi:Domain of unknown function (DUF5615)